MAIHFIAMAGLHGYMPTVCEALPTAKEATDFLADIHEIGKRRRRELRRDLYLELDVHRDGNEYCEIVECTCSNPEVHCDGGEYDEG
jgi:hypothetical protein